MVTLLRQFSCPKCNKLFVKNVSTNSFEELTNEAKLKIESKWKASVSKGTFDPSDVSSSKRYVLSMFPYPSGNLHLGHMRVYTIGDTMARFYRLNGENVFQPIGFDAFGLPAENAAFERNIPADEWTYSNMQTMSDQFKKIGFSFDWDYQLSTCNPSYYKFTQYIFLLMYDRGLVYRDEAFVNWDPIDKTVLANEQVDEEGRSWRSGAIVEKKLLKQWFIETTRFAQDLTEALDDPEFKEWRDIVSLQKHWLGECNGASFKFSILKDGQAVSHVKIWTRYPEFIKDSTFVCVKPDSLINLKFGNSSSKLDIEILNPINRQILPVFVSSDIGYEEGTDIKLVNPSIDRVDCSFAKMYNLEVRPVKDVEANFIERKRICDLAKTSGIGGYLVSSKLKDWPISRQRKWGTPIPLINCDSCGAVPVPLSDLPVLLPDVESWSNTECPKCGGPAIREKDTMDTFVDSSWYFLRFLDPNNKSVPFNRELADRMMPVDLYIGGKEHATLHLYYARFFSHFLHSIGYLSEPEPFKNLLVQGMVMGRTYKLKETGRYIKEADVSISNGIMIEKSTGNLVEETWEKMSKSKYNGVEPNDILEKYGIDATRLFMLSEVSPTSNKYWKSENFAGVLNWQKRVWALMQLFTASRVSFKSNIEKKDQKLEDTLCEIRNYYTKGVSYNFRTTFQLSVAVSKLQGLTNSLKKCPKESIAMSSEFEKCLAALIIMMSPLAPHFAAELWDNFQHLPGRINLISKEIRWDKPLFEQSWPKLDDSYPLKLVFLVNNAVKDSISLPFELFKELTQDDVVSKAFNSKKSSEFHWSLRYIEH